MNAWDKSQGCSEYFISRVRYRIGWNQKYSIQVSIIKKLLRLVPLGNAANSVPRHTFTQDTSRCLQWQRDLPQKVRSQRSCDTIWLFSPKHLCQTKWRVDILSLRDIILNISFLPVQLLLPLCLCIRPMELSYVVWGHICIYICVWCGHCAPLITFASGLMVPTIWSQSSITACRACLHLNFLLVKRYPIAIQSQ